MKKLNTCLPLGMAFCTLSFAFILAGCAQQEQAVTTTTTAPSTTSTTTISTTSTTTATATTTTTTTTAISTTTTAAGSTTTTSSTTTTTAGPTPGYEIYSGTDKGGQGFSLEYPQEWFVTKESFTFSSNSSEGIIFIGAGSWETGYPILNLWIITKGGSLPDHDAYNDAVDADRSISGEEGGGPGLISKTASTETITNLNITVEGWRIVYRTAFPLNQIYTEGTLEVEDHLEGNLTTAESEWVVFQKGNYFYDLNFNALGNKLTSREAYLHAKSSFRFN